MRLLRNGTWAVPSRHYLILQMTLPAALLGFVLLFMSGFGVRSLNKLQDDREQILARNVSSLKAVQEAELLLRFLQYSSFVFILDPSPEHRAIIQQDHQRLEVAFDQIRKVMEKPEEFRLLDELENGYQKYRREIDDQSQWPKAPVQVADAIGWENAHPIRHLLGPCNELIHLNQNVIDSVRQQNEQLTSSARAWLIVLAIGGVVGGGVLGAIAALGLSRSITRLHLQIQTAHRELDLGTVKLNSDIPLDTLDQQMQSVVDRVRDVVSQIQLHEHELLRREQLAAVGQLAAGLAHEIRNPLTGVKLLVESSLRSNEGRLNRQEIDMCLAEILRIERTVQGLLDFARAPAAKPQSYELNELIKNAMELVATRAELHGVSLTFDSEMPDVLIRADKDQITSLLTNLIINSIEATPAGGAVSISLNRAESDLVQVNVADNGSGIAPEILKRLFTPFGTTKPTGTGLGLSLALRIAEEHGGSLTAENLEAGGAIFHWTVPILRECNAEAFSNR